MSCDKFFALYDLNDELIAVLLTYKELIEYLGISKKQAYQLVANLKRRKPNGIYFNNQECQLFVYEDDEEEHREGLNPEERDKEIIELYKLGFEKKKISLQYGISRNKVDRILRKKGEN